MNPWQRFEDAWRVRCGLRPLDHPVFSGVSRVWRVALHPAHGADVVITVTDLDAGGFIEVRALAPEGRQWARIDAGLAPWTALPEARPQVWEAPLSAEALEGLASQMPRLPLHSEHPGVDGLTVRHEALVDGAQHRFSSWCPTRARAPLHHAYVWSLCELATRVIPETGGVLHPLARYLQ